MRAQFSVCKRTHLYGHVCGALGGMSAGDSLNRTRASQPGAARSYPRSIGHLANFRYQCHDYDLKQPCYCYHCLCTPNRQPLTTHYGDVLGTLPEWAQPGRGATIGVYSFKISEWPGKPQTCQTNIEVLCSKLPFYVVCLLSLPDTVLNMLNGMHVRWRVHGSAVDALFLL